MPFVRGAKLLDLIAAVPPGAQGFVPDAVQQFLDVLNVADLTTRTSGAFFVHEGRVNSASDVGLTLGPDFPVEIPGLNVGVPFQLGWVRAATGDANTELEGEPTGWVLDLVLDRVAVIIPFGQPGEVVPASPSSPAFMRAAPNGGTRVKLYARGVLRIEGGPAGTTVRLIADPDPLIPTAPSGMVIETGFSPPHLLLHDSGFGLTVDKVVLDLTDAFTPSDIMARGHAADFEGLAIRQSTLFFPRNIPFIGDVSLGVRDLLVGWKPTTSLQGEAHLEFGVPLNGALTLRFYQEINGRVRELGGPAGAGRSHTVTVDAATGTTARLLARFPTPSTDASFFRPDGQLALGPDSGWFEVSMTAGGPTLYVFQRQPDADGNMVSTEHSFAFVRSDASPGLPPHIHVRYANPSGPFAHEFEEVVFLRGPGMALDFVQFSAMEPATLWTVEDIDGLRWQWESDGSTRSGTGRVFELDTGWAQGVHTVTLTDRHGQVRRCRIEVVDVGPLFVGHRTGQVRQVVGASNVAASIRAVENSWSLMAFHATDARDMASDAATLTGGVLTVPRGTLAEVTIGENVDPTDPTTPASPTAPPVRHLRIHMKFDNNTPVSWRRIRASDALPFGPPRPYPRFSGTTELLDSPDDGLKNAPPSLEEIREWVDSLPSDTRFIVIGRCCDIRLSSQNRNVILANERYTRGRELLLAAGVDGARIQGIGEQGLVAAAGPPGLEGPLGEAAFATATNFAPAGSPLRAHLDEGWRIYADYNDTTRASWGDSQSRAERVEARGIDIYAVLSDPATTPPVPDTGEEATRGAGLMRAFVPGEDPAVTTALEPRTPQLPYRVEAKAAWDSPSIVHDADWIPTLAQLTVEWASTDVQVPGLSGGDLVAPVNPNPDTGPDLWRLIARFTTDQRSGQTTFFLSLDSMGDRDGLFAIVKPDPASRVDETVAVTLALAPALLGGITTDDPAGAGVRIVALVTAAAAAALEIDGEHVIKDGKVIVEKLEGEVRLRAIDASEGMKVRLGVDYTASFGVSANLGGAVGVSTTEPIKVRYKNVGLEYEHDTSKSELDRVRFVFEDAQFEVADPGRWSITGALGQLLGITAIRVGAGSVWVEVDIEFALDLGVVEISRTTIRIEIDTSVTPPSISVGIRGIKASINVPGAVKGGGELRILPDGFGASLELDVIPAKLKAWGSFAYRNPMVHIEGGVRFATGIPLGNTGMGLFGFAGRFVANGERNLEGLGGTPVDIYAREVGWHRRNPIEKYNPQPNQFAVGFGAIVGTLPDAAFTFSAMGMLTIGFPDISVVFSIEAVLLKPPTGEAEETRSSSPAGSGLQLLGIVAIDPTSIGVAISADYTIPRVLTLQVPIGAFFPLQTSTQGGYVRVGSDGGDGRPDRPVTVQLLPDILDLRATAFFMVEERHLRKLGKRDSLNFEGFSIGMGAGLSVKWGGGPIYLKASIAVLVGLGTRPFVLAGGLYVSGELRLVIVSLSVSGELEARITEAGSQLVGKFCGKVDFFFFSIKGCVDFTVGTEPALPAPPADPLVSGLVLADKFTRVVGNGRMAQASGDRAAALAGLDGSSTAWPDGVPVLRFAHRVRSSIPAATSGFAPSPAQGWGGVGWSGTNRVRYLYELQDVELVRVGAGGAETVLDTRSWPAAWWMPTFRPSVPEVGSTPASDHEGWDLALLRWDPAPWARAHTEGGEGLASDPAENLGRVCDPAPRPTRYCVVGGAGARLSPSRVRFAAPPSGQTPYAPDFLVDALEGVPPTLGVPQLAAIAPVFGLGFEPGARGALPAPYTPAGESTPLTHAWRLPRFTRASMTAMSLGMQGTFVPEVSEPEVLLAVCLSVPDIGGRETVCLDMSPLKQYYGVRGRELTLGTVRFRARRGMLGVADAFPRDERDGVLELTFGADGVEALLPAPTDRVSLRVGVLEGELVTATGLDREGRTVADVTARGPAGTAHTLELRGEGILLVRVVLRSGVGHLIRLCYDLDTFTGEGEIVRQIMSRFEPEKGPELAPGSYASLDRKQPRLPLPIVMGAQQDGLQAWPGEIVHVAVDGRHGCVYVRYRPRIAGPWTAFQVMPFPYFDIGVVRVCGIRHDALVAADQDDTARDDLRDEWNDASDPASAIARYQLLDPDSRYAVQVRYRAAVWVGQQSTENPPSANSLNFDAPPTGVTVTSHTPRFYFRTAAAAPLPEADVPDYEKQQAFDPRALTRYLRGFDPVAEVPSHLRRDPLLVWFDVEWVEDLLDRYGYTLGVIVRRTDPPPTPPSGDAPVILPALGPIRWGGLPYELRTLADQRLIDAAIGSRCLEDAPVEGGTLQIMADLEPRARYDLVVQAVPSAGGDAIDIGLSHFRASRYRDVTELIEATGFGVATPTPFYPLDVLVDAPPPTDPQLGDDALLDAALVAMGLDPFAPATSPRSVALWQEIGGAWRLVGVLLDSDEALLRAPRLVHPTGNPPRLDILHVTIPGLPATEPSRLVPVRTNASATRVLLASVPGIAVPELAMLELHYTDAGVPRVASRCINSLPLVVLQEQT